MRTYLLSRVGVVGDLQLRDVLSDLGGQLIWREAHRLYVVGSKLQL